MDKRQRALSILEDARNRHISFKFNLPGTQLMVFSLDKDTAIPMGSYIVDPRITKAARNGGMLYSLQLDAADVDRLVREAEEEIERQQAEGHEEAVVPIASPSSQSFSMRLVPIVRQTDESPFTFLDLLLCLAQDDAADADERAAIIDAMNALRDDGAEVADAIISEHRQDTKRVINALISVAKAAKGIKDVRRTGELVPFNVAGISEKKKLQTFVLIEHDDENVKLEKPMTPFDVMVNDAIASLYAAGNRCVTPEQTYYAMTGSSSSPSANMVDAITASVEKQSRLMTTIEFSAEMRGKKGAGDAPAYRYRAHMLEVEALDEVKTANGRVRTGYVIIAEPIRYRYSMAANKKVVHINQKHLAAANAAGSNTPDNLCIRHYLLQYIGELKRSNNKLNDHLTYAKIYEKAEVSIPDKTARSRRNRYVRGLLDAWVGSKLIKGYEEYKKNGRVEGIRIAV